MFCPVAWGRFALGPLVVVLCPGLVPGETLGLWAWGLSALGSLLMAFGLIMVLGKSLVLCARAWGLPALGSLVLASGPGLAGGSCLPIVLLKLSGMFLVSVARVCLFECLV